MTAITKNLAKTRLVKGQFYGLLCKIVEVSHEWSIIGSAQVHKDMHIQQIWQLSIIYTLFAFSNRTTHLTSMLSFNHL